MHLVINTGLPHLPFGTSRHDIVAALGEPASESTIADTPTHPASRQILEYDDYELLVTPDLGLICVTADTETLQITLNTQIVDNLTPVQLADRLQQLGSKTAVVGDPDGFDDQDVTALDMGVITSYSEFKLLNFELHDPRWRRTIAHGGT